MSDKLIDEITQVGLDSAFNRHEEMREVAESLGLGALLGSMDSVLANQIAFMPETWFESELVSHPPLREMLGDDEKNRILALAFFIVGAGRARAEALLQSSTKEIQDELVKEFVVLIPHANDDGYACVATYDSDCGEHAKATARIYKRAAVAQICWEHNNGVELGQVDD